jgi:hypothetical protein
VILLSSIKQLKRMYAGSMLKFLNMMGDKHPINPPNVEDIRILRPVTNAKDSDLLHEPAMRLRRIPAQQLIINADPSSLLMTFKISGTDLCDACPVARALRVAVDACKPIFPDTELKTGIKDVNNMWILNVFS